MSAVPLAQVRLTHEQLSRLAAEEPRVRWPRTLRSLVAQPAEAPHLESVDSPLPPDLGDAHAARLLRRGLRAFGRPWVRLRVVLRQGRLLTLTEVATDADGSAGSLSSLLLDGDPSLPSRLVQPVGRVELAGTVASALPALSLRHVPAVGASSARAERAVRPGTHTTRAVVLRGWGRGLTRPFVDAWAQDEHGWVRPGVGSQGVGGATPSGWLPVDADRFAADLAAVLAGPPRPRGPVTGREQR